MITVNVVEVERYGFTLPECIQKGGVGIAKSVDPDQTALKGAVCSGSALFAQTYLSQYLEFLRYFTLCEGDDEKYGKQPIILLIWSTGLINYN